MTAFYVFERMTMSLNEKKKDQSNRKPVDCKKHEQKLRMRTRDKRKRGNRILIKAYSHWLD